MKKKRPNPKGLTGTSRMKELGYKQIQVWLDPIELKNMQLAASKAMRTLSGWIKRTCMEQAHRVLQAHGVRLLSAQDLDRDGVRPASRPTPAELPARPGSSAPPWSSPSWSPATPFLRAARRKPKIDALRCPRSADLRRGRPVTRPNLPRRRPIGRPGSRPSARLYNGPRPRSAPPSMSTRATPVPAW